MSVRSERRGGVTTVVLGRPQVRNAVDGAAAAALVEAFRAFERDAAAHVAVLWGEGGAFCAGWDLAYAASLDGERPLAAFDVPDDGSAPPPGPMGPTRIELSKPVVAAIAGPAVGGGLELALWCDLRVMETDAYAAVLTRRIGAPLVDGGSVRLPRLIGEGRALDMVLTGRRVGAEEACRIGLCERLAEPGEGRAAAEALAREIAAHPQPALRADRRSLRGQHGRPLAEALRREWAAGAPVLESELPALVERFRDRRG